MVLLDVCFYSSVSVLPQFSLCNSKCSYENDVGAHGTSGKWKGKIGFGGIFFLINLEVL